MQANVNVLMTVYNEELFLPYAIRSCLPHVKSLTIVEGAYRESIAIGASPRSTDKTCDILDRQIENSKKVSVIYANEKSDAQQRNIGLEAIKKKDPNGWLLIIDGDEVYSPVTFKMIDVLTQKMERGGHRAAYFKSLTFVNDLHHYTEQQFPRLFKLTPEASFINDNYLDWKDGTPWAPPHVIKAPSIEFFHYSFCKGKERFDLKKRWWESRFERPFNYSWHVDDNGQITDTDHVIKEFKHKHPAVMEGHPLNK